MEETLTNANPSETVKIRTHQAKIVVEYSTGKPYYSIEWFDPSKNEYYLGYSSYNIENVTGWLSEYFEIVEKPMTNADRIRAMTDEELAKWMSGGATMSDGSCYYCKNNKLPYCDGTDCIDKSDADIILEWLQQPAEGD